MDLVQVKVVVKAWEKAFKAKHARPPTKDDIKADGGGIGELRLIDWECIRGLGPACGTLV